MKIQQKKVKFDVSPIYLSAPESRPQNYPKVHKNTLFNFLEHSKRVHEKILLLKKKEKKTSSSTNKMKLGYFLKYIAEQETQLSLLRQRLQMPSYQDALQLVHVMFKNKEEIHFLKFKKQVKKILKMDLNLTEWRIIARRHTLNAKNNQVIYSRLILCRK